MQGSPGNWRTTLLPLRSARPWMSPTVRSTRSRMSSDSASRVAAPASCRLISSRSPSRASNRSSWLCSSSAERPTAASPKVSRFS
ncbi:hypothetical protein BJF79_07645 [Actinomadura sp. CNU-125]|nr:hypothetical protein BJF79_07645 [Actinomadura sp. CNU-125]